MRTLSISDVETASFFWLNAGKRSASLSLLLLSLPQNWNATKVNSAASRRPNRPYVVLRFMAAHLPIGDLRNLSYTLPSPPVLRGRGLGVRGWIALRCV